MRINSTQNYNQNFGALEMTTRAQEYVLDNIRNSTSQLKNVADVIIKEKGNSNHIFVNVIDNDGLKLIAKLKNRTIIQNATESIPTFFKFVSKLNKRNFTDDFKIIFESAETIPVRKLETYIKDNTQTLEPIEIVKAFNPDM